MKTTLTSGNLQAFLTLLDQKGVTPEKFTCLLASGLLSDIFSITDESLKSVETKHDLYIGYNVRDTIRDVCGQNPLPRIFEIGYGRDWFDAYRTGDTNGSTGGWESPHSIAKELGKNCFHLDEGKPDAELMCEVVDMKIKGESVDKMVAAVRGKLATQELRPATLREIDAYTARLVYATPDDLTAFGSINLETGEIPCVSRIACQFVILPWVIKENTHMGRENHLKVLGVRDQ